MSVWNTITNSYIDNHNNNLSSEWIQSNAMPVVLGTNNPVSPPEIINAATMIIGTAQLTSSKYPNVSCPKIAPRRPNASVTAIPVDLHKI